MSITTTQHTRRKAGGATCCACKGDIKPGEVYRARVMVQEEFTDSDFVRQLLHESCVCMLPYVDSWGRYRDPRPEWEAPPRPRAPGMPWPHWSPSTASVAPTTAQASG